MADFQPISAYGFIGNLGSCALVGKNGSIDWCCLPRLDAPSIFASILDPEIGGRFAVEVADLWGDSAQTYEPDTNVLRTTFLTPNGSVEVTDWMHMSSVGFEEQEQHRLPAIYRLVRCKQGTATVTIRFEPRLDYARAETTLTTLKNGVLAEGGGDKVRLHARVPFRTTERGAEAVVALREGQEEAFICCYGNVERGDLPSPARSLTKTIAFWRWWCAEGRAVEGLSPGPWGEEVQRSALTLKILAGGRGIAAAATTSLPEIPGGQDNWDYRFNWIRDTSFTIQALTALGHLGDAREFLDWITEILITSGRRPSDLNILYPLHGLTLGAEEELPHLCGYLHSKPVRIGNGAATQRQHDIYGELLEAVFRSEHLHPGVDSILVNVLRDIVDYVCEIWREPDHGIWEARVEPQHHVYSKVMCWVALDRGIRLAEEHEWSVDLARWKQERAAIHKEVLEKGYSSARQSFTQTYGSDVLDATALLFPVLEFLPPDHPYALATLDTIQRELADGPLVYRTSTHHRKEGAFGFCSFWLVDALAFAGRVEEAKEHFEALLQLGNHLGLYSEEIDPVSGAFLGNFPQAFTHVGLINSAIYLARFLGTPAPSQELMGEKHLPDQPEEHGNEPESMDGSSKRP